MHPGNAVGALEAEFDLRAGVQEERSVGVQEAADAREVDVVVEGAGPHEGDAVVVLRYGARGASRGGVVRAAVDGLAEDDLEVGRTGVRVDLVAELGGELEERRGGFVVLDSVGMSRKSRRGRMGGTYASAI